MGCLYIFLFLCSGVTSILSAICLMNQYDNFALALLIISGCATYFIINNLLIPYDEKNANLTAEKLKQERIKNYKDKVFKEELERLELEKAKDEAIKEAQEQFNKSL